MNAKKQKKCSPLYYYLYKGFALIDIGLVLGALIAIIHGPVLSSLLGYAEKPWQFGVLVTSFVYVVPLLVITTLSRVFHFLWKRNTAFTPQLSKMAYISISTCTIILTILIDIICKKLFLTPMTYEYFIAMIWLIPIAAIGSLSVFSYMLIKTYKSQK